MTSKILLAITLISLLAAVTSCAGNQVFQSKEYPDVGVSIQCDPAWQMTVKSSDMTTFKHRLSGQPDYAFPPITAAKGDPTQEYANPIPNWRFIGVKGEFDPEMDPMSSDYPKPDGLYFVKSLKGELQEQQTRNLPWPGAEDVKAVVRLYEETHGAAGISEDIWHAYTVTFNHKGNALEFNMRIPSDADTKQWIDEFWKSIARLDLK